MSDEKLETTRMKEERSERIAKRIKELRINNGFSQEKLAKQLQKHVTIVLGGNVGKTVVSNLERCYQNLTIELAIAYSKVFDVSLEYVLCLSSDRQPKNRLIREETGLSDTSINIIKKLKEDIDPDYCAKPSNISPLTRINDILYQEHFMTELVRAFGRFLLYAITRNNLSHCDYGLENNEGVLIPAMWYLNKEITAEIDKIIPQLLYELDEYYYQGEGGES